MPDPTVLVIEDDSDIRTLLGTMLGRDGYNVAEAPTGKEGIRAFHEERPSMVILDVGLPDLDGWEVLERIRDMSDVPVLMLTARSLESDKVRGLNAGADDYLTKPFSRAELAARLNAIQRRRPLVLPPMTVFDDSLVRIDFVEHEVKVKGNLIELTPTEYRLLSSLVQNAGHILSAQQLITMAWDDPTGLGPSRVKYAILRLRRKLGWEETGAGPIDTVRGFGYRYRRQDLS